MDEKENKQEVEEVQESIAARRLSHFEPDIREGDGGEAVLSREPGFIGFCKHMWYHHKFGILVTAFLLVVLSVCLHQCSTRNRYDIDLLYAGPWLACDAGVSVSGMNEAFSFVMQDYDGDGAINLSYTPLFLMTDEQLSALREENANKKPEEQIYIDSGLLKSNREMLDADIMTGEMRLCLLDPHIYQYLLDNELVEDLTIYKNLRKELAEYAGITLEDETESDPEEFSEIYCIRLSDTAFGQYFTTLRGMPADTVLCVRRAGVMNQAWNGENYEATHAACADMIKNILTFEAP